MLRKEMGQLKTVSIYFAICELRCKEQKKNLPIRIGFHMCKAFHWNREGTKSTCSLDKTEFEIQNILVRLANFGKSGLRGFWCIGGKMWFLKRIQDYKRKPLH